MALTPVRASLELQPKRTTSTQSELALRVLLAENVFDGERNNRMFIVATQPYRRVIRPADSIQLGGMLRKKSLISILTGYLQHILFSVKKLKASFTELELQLYCIPILMISPQAPAQV